jgi:hypothetical protein
MAEASDSHGPELSTTTSSDFISHTKKGIFIK